MIHTIRQVTSLLVVLPLLIMTMSITACSSNNKQSTRSDDAENSNQAAALNIQLAVGYIQRDQFEIAKEKLEKAIEQEPNNVDAHKTLAYLLARLGMIDDARDEYERAIEIKPNDPDLHNSYGTFLCKQGEIDAALVEFKSAYTHPFYETPYLAYANAGACLLKTTDYVQAEAMLRRALRDQEKLPSALVSMAEIGVKTGKFLMARAYAQRYHEVSKPTAESLWLQVQAEKALGARNEYLKYAKQLIRDFPDSDEAGWAEEQARNEQLRNN
jgi:type IV pilus assembly protein PilF